MQIEENGSQEMIQFLLKCVPCSLLSDSHKQICDERPWPCRVCCLFSGRCFGLLGTTLSRKLSSPTPRHLAQTNLTPIFPPKPKEMHSPNFRPKIETTRGGVETSHKEIDFSSEMNRSLLKGSNRRGHNGLCEASCHRNTISRN